MLPTIVMPDLELWAAGWIRGALAGRSEPYARDVIASNSRPAADAWSRANPGVPYPSRMVVFRHDGGSRTNLLQTAARLAVNVWAATEQDATNLARLVEGLLLSVVDVPPVGEITSLSSPSRVDDTVPRRYFTVQVLMRGAVA